MYQCYSEFPCRFREIIYGDMVLKVGFFEVSLRFLYIGVCRTIDDSVNGIDLYHFPHCVEVGDVEGFRFHVRQLMTCREKETVVGIDNATACIVVFSARYDVTPQGQISDFHSKLSVGTGN